MQENLARMYRFFAAERCTAVSCCQLKDAFTLGLNDPYLSNVYNIKAGDKVL